MALDPAEWAAEVLELVYQPWNIEVKQYPDGGYFARVVELPGCMTEADTAAEVLEALEEARAAWIEAALADGRKIPPALAASDYSGKIFVRTSPELHRAVAEAAAREGVSMSQWASEVLSRASASRVEWVGPAVEAFRQIEAEYLKGYSTMLDQFRQMAEALLEVRRHLEHDAPSEEPVGEAQQAS